MTRVIENARWFMIFLMIITPIEFAIASGSVNTPAPYPQEITLIATIPEFGNSNDLRLNGTTIPNSVVDAYVNSQLFASALSDDTGYFLFNRILLDPSGLNNVTLIATRDDGLTGQVSGVVQVDDTDPVLTLSKAVPEVFQEQGYTFEGDVSEPVTIVFEVNTENEGGFEEITTITVDSNFSETIQLEEGNNEYRITAYDRAQNDVIISGFIYVDTTSPRILENNLDRLSPTYSRSVTIKGKISEPATVQIVLNGKNSGYQCSDGIDNDKDGFVDYPNDLGCESPTDNSEVNPIYGYACSDGIDNDGDGAIDFPADLGCDSPTDDDEKNYNGTDTQCSDGIDNDGDGLIDFDPARNGDWGCSSLKDNDESDDPDIGKVYSTKTDEDGYFSKEVTLPFSYSSSFQNPTSNSIYNSQDNGNQRFELTGSTTAIDTEVELRVIDRVGRTASREGIISYTSCSGGDGGFAVFQTGVYPASIIPDHIFQGIAQISFELELNPFIPETIEDINVDVQSREVSDEDRDKWDFNVFNPSRCSETATPDKQRWYITCQLDRWPPNAYQNITSAYDDFEEQGKISIPLNLFISYSISEGEIGSNFQQYSKTQIVCYDMEFPLDIRMDPDDIPKDLLEKSVKVIDDTIEIIDEILPIVAQVKWIIFITCLSMMGWNIVSNLGETAACLGIKEQGQELIEATIWGSGNGNINPDHKKQIVDYFKKEGVKDQMLQPFIEESAIQSTLENCIDVKQNFIRSQITMQGFCDRIFCPAIPSAQKYKYDEQLSSSSTSFCSSNFIKRYPGLAYVQGQNDFSFRNAALNGQRTLCENEYLNQWNSACFAHDPLKDSAELEKAKEGEGVSGLLNTNVAQSLAKGLSICEFGGNKAADKELAITEGGSTVLKSQTKDGRPLYRVAQEKTTAEIRDAETGEYLPDSEKKFYNEQQIMGVGGSNIYSSNAQEQYLTKADGCVVLQPSEYFYKASKSEIYDISNVNVGTTGNEIPATMSLTKYDGTNTHFKDKLQDKNGLLYTVNTDGTVSRDTYKAVVKDSGLSANGRLTKTTYRTMDVVPGNKTSMDAARGECFESNVIAEHGTNEILKDPTANIVNAVQCACLPAIEGYLISIRNILEAIRNCFESILVTGEFDAGVCKAILSQYMCDFVYDLLGCAVESFGYGNGNNVEGKRDDPLRLFFTDLKSAGDKVKDATTKRYGSADSFRTLFNERQVLRSICLAAFGYDWQPDLESAISTTGGGISINSTGIIAPATRRFEGYNPVNQGLTNNIYHVGYFLTAGEPLAWQLELLCSTTNDCDPNNFENGRCDCSYTSFTQSNSPTTNSFGPGSYFIGGGNSLGDATIGARRVIDGGQLEGGQSVGAGGTSPYGQLAGGSGSGDLYIPIPDSPVRYDKVRLCWQPTTNTGHPGCIGPIKIRQIGGNYPPFCSFSLALGKFSCGYFNQAGTAYIEDVTEWRNGQETDDDAGVSPYKWEDDIQYNVNYILLNQGEVGVLQNNVEEKDYYLRAEIIDENGVLLSRYDTLKDELLSSGSSIIFPYTKVSAKSLTENSISVLYGTGAGTELQVAGSDGTMIIRSLASNGRILASGEQESYLVFKYASNKMSYYKFPKSDIPVDGSIGGSLPKYIESDDAKNTFKDAIELSSDPDTGLDTFAAQLGYSDSGVDSATTFSLDNKNCASESTCYRVFTLRPDSTAESLSERCISNLQQPLKWKTKFTLLTADKGSTIKTQAGSVSDSKPSTVSVPLVIACSSNTDGDSNSGTIAICAPDTILTANCLCNGAQFTAGSSNNVCRIENNGTALTLQDSLANCPVRVESPFVSTFSSGSFNPNGVCQVGQDKTKTCFSGQYWTGNSCACGDDYTANGDRCTQDS